jgi:hypothetical protein
MMSRGANICRMGRLLCSSSTAPASIAVDSTATAAAAAASATATTAAPGSKLVVMWGGFGMTPRQLRRHTGLYEELDGKFETLSVLPTIFEMTHPRNAEREGKRLAASIIEQAAGRDVVFHVISGSFWISMITMSYIPRALRERSVRAITFDSTPPMSDIYAFGGWLCYALKLDATRWKNVVAHLFHPYRYFMGINSEWENTVMRPRIFGDEECVVPRSAHILFINGMNDPVLDRGYVSSFAAHLKARATPGVTIEQQIFPKARHSMMILDYPAAYKAAHLELFVDRIKWNDPPAGGGGEETK